MQKGPSYRISTHRLQDGRSHHGNATPFPPGSLPGRHIVAGIDSSPLDIPT